VITICNPRAIEWATQQTERYDRDPSSGRLCFVGRSGARQAAVMALEMLIEWHQQRAGDGVAPAASIKGIRNATDYRAQLS